MIRVKLRDCIDIYNLRHGGHLTYVELAKLADVGEGTVSSIASRPGYNVSIQTIDKLCRALEVPLHQMLEIVDDPPKSKRKRKSKAKKKTS